MLPAGPPSGIGLSSLSISDLAAAMRAGLAARMISELLRGSTRIEVAELCMPAGAGATGAVVPSESFCTIGASSAARACLSVTTSTSEAAGWSSAAMILARRCRLSA